ncbi:MAG: carboxypeptidase-like regulatory domain-containing protein, partial [Flavobacteriales bacterium]
MKHLIVLFALLLSTALIAQNATISGYITDASSGEALIGATVIDSKSGKGAVANAFGFYSLTLPQDSVKLRVSFIGFDSQFRTLKLTGNVSFNFELSGSVNLQEVEVVGERVENQVEQSQMSRIDVSLDKVKALPVLFGERDVLKTIQLMPGVQSGTEGASGLYVRGGGPDQNLILLDGVPIYNASHLFGFFSIFNTDALNSVELIKGGFPAEYGGRLSSVIDMRMKEGNAKKLKGEGGIGLIASRLTLEGPIVKDKTSFMVSGRRTYIDVLARPLIRAASNGTDGGYFFYDLNAKINHKFSDKSRLYLSGYLGRDRFFASDTYRYGSGADRTEESFRAELGWGNAIAALRWNYIFSPRLFSNTTVTYSQYDFSVGSSIETRNIGGNGEEQEVGISYNSGIRDWGGKIDFNYYPVPDHRVKFGGGYTYHTFVPGISRLNDVTDGALSELTFGADEIYAHEFASYIQDDWTVNDRLRINGGLHFSGFFVRDEEYFSLQPRISGRYLLSELTALKASYAHMAQFLHLLSNAGIGLPTDLWVPPTDEIRPQFADQ